MSSLIRNSNTETRARYNAFLLAENSAEDEKRRRSSISQTDIMNLKGIRADYFDLFCRCTPAVGQVHSGSHGVRARGVEDVYIWPPCRQCRKVSIAPTRVKSGRGRSTSVRASITVRRYGGEGGVGRQVA